MLKLAILKQFSKLLLLHNEEEGVIKLSDHDDRQKVHDNVQHRVIRCQNDQIDRFAKDEYESLAKTYKVCLDPSSEFPVMVHRVLHHSQALLRFTS